MWLEHGIQERPHCFEAVMLCGSYANTDKDSGNYDNQHVMSQALHRTPVPTISLMSATDIFCGPSLQPRYWANFITASGKITVADSRLEVFFLNDWDHEEITSFFCVDGLQKSTEREAKEAVVHKMWQHFLQLCR